MSARLQHVGPAALLLRLAALPRSGLAAGVAAPGHDVVLELHLRGCAAEE